MSSSVISSISSACGFKRPAAVIGLLLGICLPLVSGEPVQPTSSWARSVLLPAASVNLSAPTPGIISAQPIPEGSRVTAGQIILELDAREEEARLQEAQAQKDLATAEAARAEAAFLRAKELFDSNFQSQRQYDDAKAAYDRGRALIKQAEAGIVAAQYRLDRKTVRAPFDGLLLRRFKAPGEAIENFETVARLIDDSYLEMLLFADASRFGTVQIGQTHMIELLDGPDAGTQVSAEVVSVDPVIDPASGTFRFKLRVPNGNKVAVGLSARLIASAAATP